NRRDPLDLHSFPTRRSSDLALPVLGPSQTWLVLSSVVVGAFVPGIVVLVLGRVHELLVHHPAEHKTAWSVATTSFAILQAKAPTDRKSTRLNSSHDQISYAV